MRASQRARTPQEALIESQLGVQFNDISLLQQALTHRSFAYEQGGLPDNERLEFLGDSVLGLVITTELYFRFPDDTEGRLAKIRASIVSTTSLYRVGRTISIGEALLLGVGEAASGGRFKRRIIANTVEAIIGALYLDQGQEVVTDTVLKLFRPVIDDVSNREVSLDWKTGLQEYVAANGGKELRYEVSSTGPAHLPRFTATVFINDVEYGTGVGSSKKQAEKEAANEAWHALQE